VPIIRKISPVRYAGLEEIQSCIPDGYLPTVTYTKCRIDTVNSPDDGHMTVRNMQTIEINIHEKLLFFKTDLCVLRAAHTNQSQLLHDTDR